MVLKNIFDWKRTIYVEFANNFYHRTSKTLEITEHEDISKPEDESIKDENYSPDDKMVEMVSKSIGCNLPWNQFKVKTLADCTSESDFQKYLNAITKLHTQFLQIPPKCHYKTWMYSQFMDSPIKSNFTTLAIELTSYNGKVNT